MKINQQRLLTIKETASFLGISSRTIYNQLSAKKFPVRPLRLGRCVRFDIEDLNLFIAGLKNEQ